MTITPEMIADALGRPEVSGYTGHASISPPDATAPNDQRRGFASGADRDAYPLRYQRPQPDRNRELGACSRYRGGAHIDPRPGWGARSSFGNGSDVGWMGAIGAKNRGGNNPVLAGLKWSHEHGGREAISARSWIAKWLKRQDAASIVLAVAVLVAVASVVCSALTAAVQSLLTW